MPIDVNCIFSNKQRPLFVTTPYKTYLGQCNSPGSVFTFSDNFLRSISKPARKYLWIWLLMVRNRPVMSIFFFTQLMSYKCNADPFTYLYIYLTHCDTWKPPNGDTFSWQKWHKLEKTYRYFVHKSKNVLGDIKVT